jgi:hypothetical protein
MLMELVREIEVKLTLTGGSADTDFTASTGGVIVVGRGVGATAGVVTSAFEANKATCSPFL